MEDIFDFILQPLEANPLCSTGFFLLPLQLFRAFRVRNLETLVFVIFALIVCSVRYRWYLPLARTTVIKDWIISVPALAGVRGILLGIALGIIATGLRVLIGA